MHESIGLILIGFAIGWFCGCQIIIWIIKRYWKINLFKDEPPNEYKIIGRKP